MEDIIKMAVGYYLVFNTKELSKTDFQYLSLSNGNLYRTLLDNKIDMYFDPTGTDVDNSSFNIKARIFNWLRKNADGYWYIQSENELMVVSPIDESTLLNNRVSIYIELKEDIVAFKIKWHE